MPTFANAPHLLISPFGVYGIKSNFRKVFTKESFIPVCQYPVNKEFSPDLKEVGMLAKVDANGEILDILRRVFETG